MSACYLGSPSFGSRSNIVWEEPMSTSIELIERIYEASAVGDLDALVGMAAPDLVIQQDPALPWGGRYEGPNGVVEFFQRLAGTVDTGITTEALFAAGDQVIQY